MTYRSRAQFLGLPLIHVDFGSPDPLRRGTAVGWIALGNIAIGPLLAVGGVALGGISLGGFSVGALALGGLAVGGAAIGGGALGIIAAGGFAAAVWAAFGGLAVAGDYAVGGAAFATHANDAAAFGLMQRDAFFRASRAFVKHSQWAMLLCFLPVLLIYGRARARSKQAGDGTP